MPDPTPPKIGTPEWHAFVREADPATRSRLLEIERDWRQSDHEIDSGFVIAGIGFVVLLALGAISGEWAIGATVGGPIIAGGLLYAMKAGGSK